MTQTLSNAVVYHPLSDNNNNEKSTQTRQNQQQQASPQRLSSKNSDDRLYMPALGHFKACSFMLGLLVGFFIYLSTLGAEFVGVMLWGRAILEKSNHELIAFSLVWNFITTMIAIVILSSMRRLVAVVFMSVATQTRTTDNAEDVLAELLSYMEGRFAVGALIGICASWNVTNFVLGMKPQLLQSIVILVVACLWCRVTLVLLGNPEQSLIHDKKDEDEEESEYALLV